MKKLLTCVVFLIGVSISAFAQTATHYETEESDFYGFPKCNETYMLHYIDGRDAEAATLAFEVVVGRKMLTKDDKHAYWMYYAEKRWLDASLSPEWEKQELAGKVPQKIYVRVYNGKKAQTFLNSIKGKVEYDEKKGWYYIDAGFSGNYMIEETRWKDKDYTVVVWGDGPAGGFKLLHRPYHLLPTLGNCGFDSDAKKYLMPMIEQK